MSGLRLSQSLFGVSRVGGETSFRASQAISARAEEKVPTSTEYLHARAGKDLADAQQKLARADTRLGQAQENLTRARTERSRSEGLLGLVKDIIDALTTFLGKGRQGEVINKALEMKIAVGDFYEDQLEIEPLQNAVQDATEKRERAAVEVKRAKEVLDWTSEKFGLP